MSRIRISMSDLDLTVRELYDIPDDWNTKDWCDHNGKNYEEEIACVYDGRQFVNGLREEEEEDS